MAKEKKKEKELDQKKINKLFIDSMKKVATAVGKEPHEVETAEFTANDPNAISHWNMRKAGGFASLKKMYFSKPVEALDVQHGSKLVSAHRNKVEQWYGKERYMADEILKTIEEALKVNPIKMHPPVKKKTKQVNKKKTRTILAHLSDTHYGANVNKNEVGGSNGYNWTIAARRTALFVDHIANYKPHYRQETDLILCINGDIIAGMIHDQEWFADLLTIQFTGALDILSQAVSYLANNFKSVTVECNTGNHGRAMHKSSTQRATTHKWDSYESMIFLALKKLVEATHKNVKVNVPTTPYNIIQAHGHHFFMTHGDTVIDVGNPGAAMNMRSINTQIAKLNASELGGSAKFSALIVGHVHTPTIQLTESGCMLIINGCLSGTDPFAQSIGIFESHPTQQLFEITDKHAVGDLRLIQVKSADEMTELDQIVKPFKGSLE